MEVPRSWRPKGLELILDPHVLSAALCQMVLVKTIFSHLFDLLTREQVGKFFFLAQFQRSWVRGEVEICWLEVGLFTLFVLTDNEWLGSCHSVRVKLCISHESRSVYLFTSWMQVYISRQCCESSCFWIRWVFKTSEETTPLASK